MGTMQRLSTTVGVKFLENGDVALYDIRAYRPKHIAIITSDEMTMFHELFTDGCCPVCMVEIPLNDVVCDECLERAQSARG